MWVLTLVGKKKNTYTKHSCLTLIRCALWGQELTADALGKGASARTRGAYSKQHIRGDFILCDMWENRPERGEGALPPPPFVFPLVVVSYKEQQKAFLIYLCNPKRPQLIGEFSPGGGKLLTHPLSLCNPGPYSTSLTCNLSFPTYRTKQDMATSAISFCSELNRESTWCRVIPDFTRFGLLSVGKIWETPHTTYFSHVMLARL